MDRIVDIATEGHHLSAHRGFLKVEKDGVEIGRVALEDIHAVIVHSHDVTWSGSLVARLAEHGAPIVFCGSNHLPVSVTLPLEGHQAQGARMLAQISASRPLSKQIWRKIVAAKIRMQGALLASLGIEGASAFGFMADRVSSGDKENLEA